MSARDAAFRALAALADLLSRAGRVCEHVAVALLPRARLRATSAAGWEPFNRSTVALSGELFDWERAVLDGLLAPGQRVLVVGCGSGREMLALLARGLRADGLDIAPQAVARARERVRAAGFESQLLVAAIEDGPDPGARYDLVLFSWFCYCYIPDRRHRRRALDAAVRLLLPQGRIVLTYIPAPGPRRFRAAALAAAVARWSGNDWVPERGDELMLPGARGCVAFQRAFLPQDVAAEVEQAGLRAERHDVFEQAGVIVAVPAIRTAGSADVMGATSPVDRLASAP